MSSSDNLQSAVLDLVEEFLTKKTFFSINEIIDFINNRLRLNPDINRNKIEIIIKSLIKKKIIIPGTKLMKNNIIENPTRNEIYNYIKKNPSNINEIMKALNIGSNHALWHLSCLEKFQFIRSRKINNQRLFFKFDSNPELDKYYYYLKKEIIQDIINLLETESKGLKITEIANSLKKNHSTLKKYLKILKSLKLVKIEKENNKILFKLVKEEYSKIRTILKLQIYSNGIYI